MLDSILSFIYLLVLAIGTAGYLLRYRRWDRALQLFGILIPITFVTEVLNVVLDSMHVDKSPVSHIFSIFELSLTTIYFLYTNWARPPLWSLFWVCLGATFIGLIDIRIQSMNQYNTIMLMTESFIISAMALYSLFRISFDPGVERVRTYPHFILWTTQLIAWTATFFFWAFLGYLRRDRPLFEKAIIGQTIVFIVIYAVFAVVFFRADFRTGPQRESLNPVRP